MSEGITYPKRLLNIIEQMRNLVKHDRALSNGHLAVVKLSSKEFSDLWDAAKYYANKIDCEIERNSKFSDRKRSSYQSIRSGLKAIFDDSSLKCSWAEYSQKLLTDQPVGHLEVLDADFDEKEILEKLSPEEAASLANKIEDLIVELNETNLGDDIKGTLRDLLYQMRQIFESIEALGEREIEQLVERWTMTVARYHSILSDQLDEKSRGALVDLTLHLWKSLGIEGEMRLAFQGKDLIKIGLSQLEE